MTIILVVKKWVEHHYQEVRIEMGGDKELIEYILELLRKTEELQVH